MPGAPGGPGSNSNNENYRLNPDDYVTAVVPITRLAPIPPGFKWGKGPDGKAEHIGIQGHFSVRTKYGTSYLNFNQGDIVLDIVGPDKAGIDRFPEPKKQVAAKKTEKQHQSPEGQVQLAEWCLEVGLPDEAAAILERLSNHANKDAFKPTTTAAVQAFAKVKDILSANIDRSERANQWKERLGARYPALSLSKHYAIVHQDIMQKSADRRLEALENNFKTIYLWFALRGRALPAPTEKLAAIIVGDATDFRHYRDTFEATNLVADGFHARRENLAVFSGRRLDKASVNFDKRVSDIYREAIRKDDLFRSELPKIKEYPTLDNFRKYSHASMMALVDNLLEEEAEIASATHEGTKQLFAETGLLPRNVMAPEWVRFGIGALFEMPKGPFPGDGASLQVALYPGGGGPNWAYMRYFEELRDKKLLTGDNAPDVFIDTVLDQHFKNARRLEASARSASRRDEEGDSKATQAEQQYAKARTYAWSLMFYLAKTHFREFEAFMRELSSLPRDAELDAMAVIVAFCKAYNISETGLTGASVDPQRFMSVGLEWLNFMGTVQSPSRKLKIESIVIRGGAGNTGGPGGPAGGFPGMPGAPGGPGGGGGGGPGGNK